MRMTSRKADGWGSLSTRSYWLLCMRGGREGESASRASGLFLRGMCRRPALAGSSDGCLNQDGECEWLPLAGDADLGPWCSRLDCFTHSHSRALERVQPRRCPSQFLRAGACVLSLDDPYAASPEPAEVERNRRLTPVPLPRVSRSRWRRASLRIDARWTSETALAIN